MRNLKNEMDFDNTRDARFGYHQSEQPKASGPKPAKPPKKAARTSRKRSYLGFLLFLLLLALSALVFFEVTTSHYQSQFIHKFATRLTYEVQDKPSDNVIYPSYGPFDHRHGYTKLPEYLKRLHERNFRVTYQTTFSPELIQYTQLGFFPPYHEKAQSGLTLMDCKLDQVYSFAYPKRVYQDGETIPLQVINTLLFIENRELWTSEPHLNPVIDWPRFVVAGFSQIAEMMGLNVSTAGGSTLATQIEKFRHSEHGLTSSIQDKLLQIGSASVRVYQQGEETAPARARIVQDYLNTVPLSSAPIHGEVHGVGDGLWAWFGTDFNQANALLLQEQTPSNAAARGQVFRQIVALMIAQRRPSYYLLHGHEDLERLVDSHIRLLGRASLVESELTTVALEQRLQFNDFKNKKRPQITTDKGVNSIRIRTGSMLNTSLYDLDRTDLDVYSTLQGDLQLQVSQYLTGLAKAPNAEAVGLLGEKLLTPGQLSNVVYSFTLYESTPEANQVRVQTDSSNQPFDINESSKLELGSTAKLRVLATYLDIVAELHERLTPMGRSALMNIEIEAKDRITRWVVDYLLTAQDKSLTATLNAAMQRHYSASPNERFFTGGGLHVFNNFKREENSKNPTIYEALQQSINLPFVRLMREIVNYTSSFHNEGSIAQLLKNDKDPRREEYLKAFSAREGTVFVNRFYRKYKKIEPALRFETLFDGLPKAEQQLVAAYRYLLPNNSLEQFTAFLAERLPEKKYTESKLNALYNKYGPDKFNLADQGYITRTHPLELWVLTYLNENPEAKLADVRQASQPKLQEVYRWLFKTRHKNARDVRVQVMLEVEAFLDIHQRWVKMGYPFDSMVPSLGSALGSSGDRPAALAELMGIIQNEGKRLPTVRIKQLHFADNTPYEVSLVHQSQLELVPGQQVMRPEVAASLKNALTNVVENGTGRRLKGIFKTENGEIMPIGGKTGTGDNRIVTQMTMSNKKAATAMNRTATFVFYLGDNYFGTLTAFVPGAKADDFSFTSALPLQVMKGMMPILAPYVQTKASMCEVF
ncbi:transglycosylase domain-containing protein [Shewanella sp. SNU WT4]|uniref:transglycosylase domain-containing protein n=1 Tax=Shewanella sp. SNU WT4 TaxID=2590015 RepID=UPI001F0D6800|nr:transglycosylase domain-containing protein [Shewanella sp. SNU WT4]